MAKVALNNCKMNVSAVAGGGTGAFTLNTNETGFQSFTSATPTPLGDGDTSTFMAVETGGLWELFIGTYTAAGTSLARTTTIDSSNGGANETFTTAVTISAVADAANMVAHLTPTDGNFIVGDGTSWVAESGATARTSLGLTIGTDVQAYDAELAAIAGLTSAADTLPYFTGSGTASTTTLTSFARSILDDANEATFKATVNLEPGTDVQAYSADLAAIAALAKTDGNFIVGNGSAWVAESGSTARTSLGLGSLATASTINNDNWTGTDLAVANGGTGASDAATARSNLGCPTDTPTIAVPFAAADFRPTSTNGAQLVSVETTAGRPEIIGYAFDTTTEESIQKWIPMPKGWNEGTITAKFYWTSTTAADGGVAWGISGVAMGDNDTMDVAFGTEVVATDTEITIEDVHVTSRTAAMTFAGTPQAEDIVCIQISRVVANGSDTFTQDAVLVGVSIEFTLATMDDT